MINDITTKSTYIALKKLTIFYGYSNISSALESKGVTVYRFPMDKETILENFKKVKNKTEVLELTKNILRLDNLSYDESTSAFDTGIVGRPIRSTISGLSGGTSQFIGVATILLNYGEFGKNGVYILHPEASLHPKSQSALGEFIVRFYDASKHDNSSSQLFIDTFSEHILNGMKRILRNETRDVDNVVINYINEGYVMSIFIKENGELSSYADGFMDQHSKDFLELFKSRK
jgi:predicted ATPase